MHPKLAMQVTIILSNPTVVYAGKLYHGNSSIVRCQVAGWKVGSGENNRKPIYDIMLYRLFAASLSMVSTIAGPRSHYKTQDLAT